MYKYDMHVHTGNVSPCGRVRAKDIVHLYKDAGYTGIVVTDHFFYEYFERLGDLSWEQKIDRFLEGYREALEEGGKLGLDIILGMELRFRENLNDYLVYGVDEDSLVHNPDICHMTLKQFRSLTTGMNVLIYQAHPFRIGMERAAPSLIDGIEVYNGNPRHNSSNHLALEFAIENGLKTISGSDFHQVMDLARGGMEIPERVGSQGELLDILNSSKVLKLLSTD